MAAFRCGRSEGGPSPDSRRRREWALLIGLSVASILVSASLVLLMR